MNERVTEEQIEQINVTIESAKKSVKMRDDLRKLIDNPLFDEVIIKGYFEGESSRLVLLRADPSMESEINQKRIDHGIIAIGNLRQYFRTIVQIGGMAEKSLSADEETHDQLLSETGGA